MDTAIAWSCRDEQNGHRGAAKQARIMWAIMAKTKITNLKEFAPPYRPKQSLEAVQNL